MAFDFNPKYSTKVCTLIIKQVIILENCPLPFPFVKCGLLAFFCEGEMGQEIAMTK